MIVGILGLGQVGEAIRILCQDKYHIVRRDLNLDEFSELSSLDILHVCIPFSDAFESIVVQTIKDFRPNLVIINSTIAPGTTELIYKKTHVDIAHAPVLGKHPQLAKYQKIFLKPIGAVNSRTYERAKEHFSRLGVKTTRFKTPKETELAKLLDTTYYALNILFEKWAWNLCNSAGIDHQEVYSEFNKIYNDGYSKELPNVRRPILKHKPGPIGGHCVVPNLLILKQWLQKIKGKHSDWVEFMENKNQELKLLGRK